MDENEARQVQSEVGRLQGQFVREGMSQNDARKKALDSLGERARQAQQIWAKKGREQKAKMADAMDHIQPMLTSDVIAEADAVVNCSAIYRSICEKHGWVPNDRLLADILNPPSGYRSFSAARSYLKKSGFIFTSLPNGMGYAVQQDVNARRRAELRRQYSEAEEQRMTIARNLAEADHVLAMLKQSIQVLGG